MKEKKMYAAVIFFTLIAGLMVLLCLMLHFANAKNSLHHDNANANIVEQKSE